MPLRPQLNLARGLYLTRNLRIGKTHPELAHLRKLGFDAHTTIYHERDANNHVIPSPRGRTPNPASPHPTIPVLQPHATITLNYKCVKGIYWRFKAHYGLNGYDWYSAHEWFNHKNQLWTANPAAKLDKQQNRLCVAKILARHQLNPETEKQRLISIVKKDYDAIRSDVDSAKQIQQAEHRQAVRRCV